MPKNNFHAYHMAIRIRDVGDERLTLFLIGIGQRPIGPDNFVLINESSLRQLLDTACSPTLSREVYSTLKQDSDCTIRNFGILREPCSDPNTAKILEWLVYESKKANQTDGMKRAFRERTTGMRGPHIRWHEKRGLVKASCEFCNIAQTSS